MNERKKVVVLGTFRRHTVPPEVAAQPVLDELGWDPSDVVCEQVFVDGREALDFSVRGYLEDALRRTKEGLNQVCVSDYDVVVLNATGFNPSAFILVANLTAIQGKVAVSGEHWWPQLWAVYYDREEGYRAYEIGPYNGFLREHGLS